MRNHNDDDGVFAVLVASAVGRWPVLLELQDGSTLHDGVCEVARECGEDVVYLHANNRMLIRDIARVEPRHDAGDEYAEFNS